MSIEVGSKLEGKVTGITHFGAFVELPEGVTGLVHISEIADNYVKDVNEFLKVNDVVKVKVINVEKDGKIGLSIKQAQDRPADESKPAFNRPERDRTVHKVEIVLHLEVEIVRIVEEIAQIVVEIARIAVVGRFQLAISRIKC